MAAPEHLTLLLQGTQIWNEWRAAHPAVSVDLRDADLRESTVGRFRLLFANLREADLRGAHLDGQYLIRTDLRETDLRGATLRGIRGSNTLWSNANLTGANLRGAHLNRANLRHLRLIRVDLGQAHLQEADLRGADLTQAVLRDTKLDNARFAGSVMAGTALMNLDLRAAHGLEEVSHHGLSSLGLDTITRSHGQIPLAFLRGCGLSDAHIAAVPTLCETPPYAPCCLVYGAKDAVFAHRLFNALQEHGVRCWLQKHPLSPDPDAYERHERYEFLERERHPWDKILLCCSRAALASAWMKDAIHTALAHEHKLEHRSSFLSAPSTTGNVASHAPLSLRVLLSLSLDGYLEQDWRSLRSKAWPKAFDAQTKAQINQLSKRGDGGLIKAVRARLVANCQDWESNDTRFTQAVEALLPALNPQAMWECPDDFRVITLH